MKKLLLIIAVGIVGCKEPALQTVETTNHVFKVELLFTVDGCNVYRFEDANRYRYLTTCKGSVQHTERSGKTDIDVYSQTN